MTAKDHQKMAPIIPLVKKWAQTRNIPYDMLYRQIWKESAGNPKAVGDFGNSRGLMQLNKNSAVKEMKADFDKLFDPEYNLQMGTGYLARVRSLIFTLLPKNQTEAWAITFMAYNSGYGYAKKALERIRSRGIMEPTLKMVLEEMNSSGFGRTPIFGVTVPYTTFITTGVEKNLSDIVKSKLSSLSDMIASSASKATETVAQNKLVFPFLLGAGLAVYILLKQQRVIT